VRLNLILSVGFGILMGIVFPLYANLFVTFKNTLLLIIFAVGCIIAGIIVGFGAFLITRLTILKVVKSVSSELREIANG
jgi:methyl-accepting chemotaxis protein